MTERDHDILLHFSTHNDYYLGVVSYAPDVYGTDANRLQPVRARCPGW